MHGFEMRTVLCEDCGLCFMNPLLAEEDFAAYYDGDYERFHGIKQAKITDLKSSKGFQIGRFLQSELPGTKSVYEIGCSAGGNLAALKECFGWEVHGSDPSTEARASCLKFYDIDIDTGLLKDALPSLKGHDVVLLADVIEHLTNPLESIQQLHRSMDPNSHLLLETLALDVEYPPKGLEGYLRVCHPYNFTVNTLQTLVERGGFVAVKTQTLGGGLVRLLAKRAEQAELFRSGAAFRNPKRVEETARALLRHRIRGDLYRLATWPIYATYLFLLVLEKTFPAFLKPLPREAKSRSAHWMRFRKRSF
jgi:2-polyprenyl-3-methyl-5-hydroxy-6-metoxy-1,4-benzoquinol methylase